MSLDCITLMGVNLNYGLFDTTSFQFAHLVSSQLVGCSLVGAHLWGTVLAGVNLTNASLLGVEALETRLILAAHYSSVHKTIFSDVRLHGTNLQDAELHGAVFINCTADARTVWPEGFNPEQAGIVIEGT